MSGDGIGRLTQMLELNEFKLNSLLEITKGINNNLSIPNILKIYEYILREQLGISKLLLYAYDQKNWKCILHFGAKGLNKKIKCVVTIHDVIFKKFPGFYSRFDKFIYSKKTDYACKNAKKIICVSKQTKEDLISFMKVPSKNS